MPQRRQLHPGRGSGSSSTRFDFAVEVETDLEHEDRRLRPAVHHRPPVGLIQTSRPTVRRSASRAGRTAPCSSPTSTAAGPPGLAVDLGDLQADWAPDGQHLAVSDNSGPAPDESVNVVTVRPNGSDSSYIRTSQRGSAPTPVATRRMASGSFSAWKARAWCRRCTGSAPTERTCTRCIRHRPSFLGSSTGDPQCTTEGSQPVGGSSLAAAPSSVCLSNPARCTRFSRSGLGSPERRVLARSELPVPICGLGLSPFAADPSL